ncbi:hypothetical protein [Noviherbaspirillum galbum]|uniref:Uncharacterized protein n=1 Tax=Noviherbaspirillum galbum TaxID=2709383 RepID=A0A6B3SN23_9BURK|nr:hypothetical protein [Noviherbaspirillum galbum]NEX60146.1 hypothetical protein [Noviherbaspirillum galbum]
MPLTATTRIVPLTLTPPYRQNTPAGQAKRAYYDLLWQVANSQENTVGAYLQLCSERNLTGARYPGQKSPEIIVKPEEFVSYAIEHGWLAKS